MKYFNKLINWYFKKNSLPYWCVIILDCLIVYGSAFIVYWSLHRGSQTQLHFYSISYVMLLYLIISIITFRLFHTYSGVIRYSSFVDLMRVAYANGTACFIVWLLHYYINDLPEARFAHLRSIEIIGTYIVATAIMWMLRVLVKNVFDVEYSTNNGAWVYIYGIKEGGMSIAKYIRNQKPTQFVLKGFISHEKDYQGKMLMGVRVHKVDEKLSEHIEDDRVEAVLVPQQRMTQFRNDEQLQSILTERNLKIYATEGIHDAEYSADNQVSTIKGNLLKEVSIEDLLPRDEIKVDLKKVGEMLTDRRILVTGSAGSIGSEMVRQIATFHPAEMMLIDQAETPQHDIRLMMSKIFPYVKAETVVTSITNEKRMDDIFNKFRPEYVFHAAAYKHVPMMEDNPSESVINNIMGTKILADLSVKYKVKKFVMISTDKAVNPTNVMGCSKRICEIYVQSLNQDLLSKKAKNPTQFVTTRFGNVLGSNGSVIPLFKKQIQEGGPVTVTDPNIIRFFMLIPEACKLVLEAGTMGNGGEIFVFDMGKPVKIAELAERMIQLSGAKNIEIRYTGLRPGEKLYEEVLSTEENTKPSFHEKIRIANVREYDYHEVNKDIEELINISLKYNDMDTVKKMKQIVPEYKSNNSIYKRLD
ncbi:MAG: polysaccharide biosynthesis protein [Prevotella sp.]|nr:polysaccharide biosynthesis protein [Prevotella sp.]